MSEPQTYTASEARNNFSDVMDAALRGKPVLITKGKKKTVAVISIEQLRALTDIEALFDIEKAEAALKEFLQQGGMPLKQIKKDLGIP